MSALYLLLIYFAHFFSYCQVSCAPTVISSSHANSTYPALLDATLDDLVAGLRAGQFTSVDLVKAYVLRIQAASADFAAVTELNPDALTIAASLDVERAKGTLRSPLHGIPILLKDNIGTADQMNNTAGSYALVGAKVPTDSTVAAKLRAAGAILLGKANLSQWANWRSTGSSDGWSAYGGQVKGAYFPSQDPLGSSSGSAVAVSLGLAFAALGTETQGSIIAPAEVANVVGIKPTVGLTSRNLVIPISEHMDTVGPITRTVKDGAYVLQAIAGKDAADNYTSVQPFFKPPDYVAACNMSSLRGKRLGIPWLMFHGGESDPPAAAFAAAIKVLKDAGAIIVDNTDFTQFALQNVRNYAVACDVLGPDFVDGLSRNYLSKLIKNPHNITNVYDLIKFTHTFPLEQFPKRDTDRWDATIRDYPAPINNSNSDFAAALNLTQEISGPQGISGVLNKYSLDALILPSSVSYFMPSYLGGPVITVPMGSYPDNTSLEQTSDYGLVQVAPNIPFGISFFAEKWSEEKLIGMAYAFEQRTKIRETIKPHTVPETELKDVVGHNNDNESSTMLTATLGNMVVPLGITNSTGGGNVGSGTIDVTS